MLEKVAKFDVPSLNGFEIIQQFSVGWGFKGPPGLNRINDLTKDCCTWQAGIVSREHPEQLKIALEPEAAALFCTMRKIDAIQSERLSASVDGLLTRPNAQYMVADIGGNNFKSYTWFPYLVRFFPGTVTECYAWNIPVTTNFLSFG